MRGWVVLSEAKKSSGHEWQMLLSQSMVEGKMPTRLHTQVSSAPAAVVRGPRGRGLLSLFAADSKGAVRLIICKGSRFLAWMDSPTCTSSWGWGGGGA